MTIEALDSQSLQETSDAAADAAVRSPELDRALVDTLIEQRDQALVDLESWRVAMTALLGELILHEMPISKLATYVDKVQSDMQHQLQYGSPLRHAGALAAASDLVGKVEHASEWRRMAWENDKKKREGDSEPPPPVSRSRKNKPDAT